MRDLMGPCRTRSLQALAACATSLSISHGGSSTFVPEDAIVYETQETRELAAKYPPATFPWYKKLTANHGPQHVLFTARVGGKVIHHGATCELIRTVLESLPSMGECGLHSVSAPSIASPLLAGQATPWPFAFSPPPRLGSGIIHVRAPSRSMRT